MREPRSSRRPSILAIAAVGAVALALYFVWPSGLLEERPDAPTAATPPPMPARATSESTVDVAPVPGPSDAAVVAIDTGIAQTSLPLKLLVTSAQEDASLSFARIEDLQHGHEQVAKAGRTLRDRPKVTLVAIEPESVLLDNYGVVERLPLDPDGNRFMDRSTAEAATLEMTEEEHARRQEIGRRLRELTDAGADYERRHDVEGVLSEVDMQPLYSEEGELMGVRLSDVEPDGFFATAGLHPGDVVTSINGRPFGSPSAVADLASDFALNGEFALAVERPDGSQEVVTVSADSINEAVAAQD